MNFSSNMLKSTLKAVEGLVLALECPNDVHSSDGLAATMLAVNRGVMNRILEKFA